MRSLKTRRLRRDEVRHDDESKDKEDQERVVKSTKRLLGCADAIAALRCASAEIEEIDGCVSSHDWRVIGLSEVITFRGRGKKVKPSSE
jgi:hypothetical protein